MIKSKFISDLLEILLDGDDQGDEVRPQIQFLTEADYEYTGRGVFITFSHDENIIQYRSREDKLILDGVKITSSEFSIEAEAILFFDNGIVECLEIWCYLGDYPKTDVTKYTLTQIWKNSPGRQVSTEEIQ